MSRCPCHIDRSKSSTDRYGGSDQLVIDDRPATRWPRVDVCRRRRRGECVELLATDDAHIGDGDIGRRCRRPVNKQMDLGERLSRTTQRWRRWERWQSADDIVDGGLPRRTARPRQETYPPRKCMWFCRRFRISLIMLGLNKLRYGLFICNIFKTCDGRWTEVTAVLH